jgi:hypothetical protein
MKRHLGRQPNHCVANLSPRLTNDLTGYEATFRLVSGPELGHLGTSTRYVSEYLHIITYNVAHSFHDSVRREILI